MKTISGAVALCLLAVVRPGACQADGPYRFVKEIPLAGKSWCGSLSIDSASRRLYAPDAARLSVIDLDTDKMAGEMAAPGVRALALAPRLGRGFSINGTENKANIIDLNSLKTLFAVDIGEKPASLLYVPNHEELFVFNEEQSASVFQAHSGTLLTTIKLSGKPGVAVLDSGAEQRIYCPLEDKNEIAAISIRRYEEEQTWPIAPGKKASGLAFDVAHHRLFLGCANKLLIMMDSLTGKIIASAPSGEGASSNAFDPETRLVFSSTDGTTTIARQDTPDTLKVIQTLKTEKGVRVMTLDPKTHNLYFAATTSKGGLKILVYGMAQ